VYKVYENREEEDVMVRAQEGCQRKEGGGNGSAIDCEASKCSTEQVVMRYINLGS